MWRLNARQVVEGVGLARHDEALGQPNSLHNRDSVLANAVKQPVPTRAKFFGRKVSLIVLSKRGPCTGRDQGDQYCDRCEPGPHGI